MEPSAGTVPNRQAPLPPKLRNRAGMVNACFRPSGSVGPPDSTSFTVRSPVVPSPSIRATYGSLPTSSGKSGTTAIHPPHCSGSGPGVVKFGDVISGLPVARNDLLASSVAVDGIFGFVPFVGAPVTLTPQASQIPVVV